MPQKTRAEIQSMRADLEIWSRTNPRLSRTIYREYTDLRANVAREDVDEFMEFVFLDDKTQEPVYQEPIHERFQQLAERHKRLIIWGHVESGKTTQLAVGRTLWKLGRDPNMRVAVIGSVVTAQSGSITGALKSHIERNQRLRKVFPNLRPSPHGPWSANRFTIDRPSFSRDPTVQATSEGTAGLTGARIDLMIVDDLITFDNTRTKEAMDNTYNYLQSTGVMGRLTEDSQLLILGNAWHPEDAMHRLSRLPGFHFARFPVMDAQGNLTWPERWSRKRIEERRQEVHPDEFARQLMCISRDESSGRFKRDWIEACMHRGLGKRMTYSLDHIPPGYAVYTGVDLGHRKKRKSDHTVIFTIAVHPNETREVLNIESSRKAGNEIVDSIINTYNRYNGVVYVENNGAQQYIVDFTKEQSAVPVKPLFTGKNKWDPIMGLEGLATEMSNHKWIIPSDGPGRAHPEIMAWVDEMLYYDPSAHTGDRLMASWFAREGARLWAKRPKMKMGRIDVVSR